MDRLADQSIASISAQLAAGADAFQLFDSWAGALSAADYRRFVQPHSARVFATLAERFPDVPGIHFGIGCDHLLEAMFEAGADRDRSRLAHADRRRPPRLGADVAVQGNLDPALVLAGAEVALAGADAVLADNAGHPAHIFNLGHGVPAEHRPRRARAVGHRPRARRPSMTVGVVLMAYGTPSTAAELPAVLHDIRRGRPPTDEQLAELAARYDAIGRRRPLPAHGPHRGAGGRAAGRARPDRTRRLPRRARHEARRTRASRTPSARSSTRRRPTSSGS